MRIASRIFVVGAIPIAIAAGIAIAAILLLTQANRARSSAILAGTVFRTVLTAVTVRNEFIRSPPEDRSTHAAHFFRVAERARNDLGRLRDLGRSETRATREVSETLATFVGSMERLVAVTASNDALVGNMMARAASLIALTDQARERQHASNADIVTSLQEGDRKLRQARNVVDAAYGLRMAVASIQTEELELQRAASAEAQVETRRKLLFDLTRLGFEAADLLTTLSAKDDGSGLSPSSPVADVPARMAALKAGVGPTGMPAWSDKDREVIGSLSHWAEQLLKINSAEYRAYHDEASQLLTYSVQAHDTELATQNIAIVTLKLSNRASTALLRRDEPGARAIYDESRGLVDAVSAQPISPLIQTEMIDALNRWREGLGVTTDGLRQQNTLLTTMDAAAASMVESARSIDTAFSRNAEENGQWVGTILLLGAATGLLLGGTAAYFVARSITQPLEHLQSRMTLLAADPESESIVDSGRRDELGDMARATNTFLVEIARRERAISRAKERADAALKTLQQTQAELIQIEKLASLGQLVAGIAHEINTPIGIALTTATVVDDEARVFRTATADGKVSRMALTRLIERVSEGATLLTTNLSRAADLIQSFKHVAADQVSGEQRVFDVQTWLQQLLTSLGPMLRKSGHTAIVESPEGLTLDTYPGALAQVVTNLVVNASLHAFEKGEQGKITLAVHENGKDMLRLVVGDNGRGIAAEHRGKIFDPFFTTRRSEGSTGLGLHIVFNLVTSTLHGRIYFESVPGAGTRFIIDLPRAFHTNAEKPPSKAEAAA